MKKPSVTIRYGATSNSVTVDGHAFDLTKMTAGQRTFLRKTVAGGLTKAGVITNPLSVKGREH